MDYEDLSDRLKLDNVRQSLIRQEDSIILAHRAQAVQAQHAIYQNNAVPVPCFTKTVIVRRCWSLCFERLSRVTVKFVSSTSPDEHAFYSEALPQL